MDLQFLAHPSFLLFAGAQAGVALALALACELLHRRLRRRGADPVRTRRSRIACRAVVGALFALGVSAYAVPAYHPLLGEHYLREALADVEADRSAAAREAFERAAHHLGAILRATQGGGVWGRLVGRFVEPWGGPPAVHGSLGTAHFLLGDCRRALPHIGAELRARPSASRTALLSYRSAVCHAGGGRREAATDALLRALLIDRRYVQQVRKDPRLKTLAEDLLSRRL